MTFRDGFHIQCQRDLLVTALMAADAVVPSNSAKPILTNLLFEAREQQLEIAATDLQVGLRCIVPNVDVRCPGQVVVSARKVVHVLKESRSPSVLLELQEHGETWQLHIQLADGSYRLPAVMGETFPQVSEFPEGEMALCVSASDLATMMRKTGFAVDKERTSAVLSGVLLQADEEHILMAATDGKVLAEYNYKTNTGLASDHDIHVILPAATIGHLSRILDTGARGMVDLAVVGKVICVRALVSNVDESSTSTSEASLIRVELTSRCIEGTYPPYRNALPHSRTHTLTFSREELASSVRRTALMTSSASPGIVLTIRRGEAELSNMFNTTGSVRIPLRCSYDGEQQRMGLNASYLTHVLKALDDDDVVFELNGPGKGIITKTKELTYLVMPITLSNS